MNDRKQFRLPTPEEVTALNAAARRSRALALRQVLHACTLTLKALAARFTAVPAGKGMRHA